jgi:ABC-type nitrate/sulfonate/bicarbonate transport system substrate-binding protein
MKTLVRSLTLAAFLSTTSQFALAEEVTIRFLASHGGISAHELAAELGYYDDAEIKLENVGYAAGGPESLIALAGGSVELGSAATAAVLNSIAGGNDFVAAYPSNGINDEAQSIFYVLEDSPIREIKDIVGKTIAVNTLGAHLDYAVREALHQNGLPQESANLIVVPGPQLEQVLRSKQVDISAFGYPGRTIASFDTSEFGWEEYGNRRFEEVSSQVHDLLFTPQAEAERELAHV